MIETIVQTSERLYSGSVVFILPWSSTNTPRPLHMSDRVFVLVSGLPASGKTTLAKHLAPLLGLPHYDKDDILEALFDSIGVEDLAGRQRLSRASDAVLAKLASTSQGAILTSFWRHEEMDGTAGTPFQWVRHLSNTIVEIYCECPPDIALDRFLSRSRHAGHQDHARTPTLLAEQFREVAMRGPLHAGVVMSVNTEDTYDITAIARQVREVLEITGSAQPNDGGAHTLRVQQRLTRQ